MLGVISIDFYIAEYNIAIELDGPSHFVICDNKTNPIEISGTTEAKRRFLQECGLFNAFFKLTGNTATTNVSNYDQIMD